MIVRVGGVLLELFGTALFLLLLVIDVTLGRRGQQEAARARTWIFGLAFVGITTAAWVAWGAAGWFADWLHAAMAACVAAVFILSGLSEHASLTTIPRSALSDAWHIVRVAPTWAATAALIGLVAARPSLDSGPSLPTGLAFEAWFRQQPRVTVGVDGGDASVLIVKAHDYECGPCRAAYERYDGLVAKMATAYPGRVRFTTLDYPLERECNSHVSFDLHPAACEAAVAVRLARERGRDSEMETWLFANQERLDADLIRAAVARIAGVEDFDGRYAAVLQLVRRDVEIAHAAGVSGTPTLFVNGVRIPAVPRDDLERAILLELRSPAGSADRGPAGSVPRH